MLLDSLVWSTCQYVFPAASVRKSILAEKNEKEHWLENNKRHCPFSFSASDLLQIVTLRKSSTSVVVMP
jgi:hypothetical protein